MTNLGVDGAVAVEDRAAECMTAIARNYEEGMAQLAFLARLWDAPLAPPIPALPVMVRVAEPDAPAEPAAPLPAAPFLAEEPAMLPMAVAPADVPVEASPDAPTAVELPVVALPEATAEDEQPTDEDAVVITLAEAITAEIPVQAAA